MDLSELRIKECHEAFLRRGREQIGLLFKINDLIYLEKVSGSLVLPELNNRK